MTDPVPLKLQILQWLCNYVETMVPPVSAGGDGVTTMAGSVFRGRAVFGDEAPIPAISFLEAAKAETPLWSGDFTQAIFDDKWCLVAQGWVKDDRANPTDPAHYLGAALVAHLAVVTATNDFGDPVDPANFLMGYRVANFRMGQYICRPPEKDVSSKAFFYMPIWIGLAYDFSNPYGKLGAA